MNLAKLKPEVQRAMAITVPLLVLLLAALLIVPKGVGIWAMSRQLAARNQEIALRKQQRAWEAASRHTQRLPARPQSKGEQLEFLNELGRIVAASHVHLVSYHPPAAVEGASPPADASAGEGEALKPLAIEATVSGSYGHLVGLFGRLASADRLFAVENLEVRTDAYPRLTAAFRLVRYVTPVRVAIAPADRLW